MGGALLLALAGYANGLGADVAVADARRWLRCRRRGHPVAGKLVVSHR